MVWTKYDTTASNNTATPPDGAPEGMAANTVNNTMRDMMAEIRLLGNAVQGGTVYWAGTTAGSSNAYSLSVSPSVSALYTGQPLVWIANHTKTGTGHATLSPSSQTAKNIVLPDGTSTLTASDIISGRMYLSYYDGTSHRLLNPSTRELSDARVTNAHLANMANNTFKGNVSGGIAAPSDLSVSSMVSALGILRSVSVQKFTANGTYTPTTGMTHCLVFATGGGGGGGGNQTSGGGGGGGGAETIVAVLTASDIGASKSITIGTAGTAGTAGGGNGGDGGDTSLGTLIVSKGGKGGTGIASGGAAGGRGGQGGTVPTAGLSFSGSPGQASTSAVNVNPVGGSSTMGGGGKSGTGGAGSAGENYGGGGSGASGGNHAGGAGAPGAILIVEFINA